MNLQKHLAKNYSGCMQTSRLNTKIGNDSSLKTMNPLQKDYDTDDESGRISNRAACNTELHTLENDALSNLSKFRLLTLKSKRSHSSWNAMALLSDDMRSSIESMANVSVSRVISPISIM